MKQPIRYIDRLTGEIHEEHIYCESALRFLYDFKIGRCFARLISTNPLFSKLYGWWQNLSLTKRKILPFVQKFGLNPQEFEKPLSEYASFNAFFTRKLKPHARPLEQGIILPADGRYFFYQNINECDGFLVKGKTFKLPQLLGNQKLADTYQRGSLVLARLCPTDYHRFHFPCDCIPEKPHLINGPLYSVNPIATRSRIEIFAENKRVITKLLTKHYGEILFIEVGATNVGAIHQTYTPNKPYKKGDEKGFFSFGGSSIIILFQPGSIQIESSLLNNSFQHLETLCLVGQSLENKK